MSESRMIDTVRTRQLIKASTGRSARHPESSSCRTAMAPESIEGHTIHRVQGGS